MLMLPENQSFVRYLRLYTLHAVEQTATHQRILQARVTTVRYVFQPLSRELNQDWQTDASQSVDKARSIIIPRLHNLLDDDTEWQHLLHETDRWQPYLELRRAGAMPSIPQIPASKPVSRLGRAERWLQITKTALEVANTGLVLWQSWRRFQDERRLLQDSIRAMLTGGERALDHALEPGFIQGYLAEHGDDPAYDAIFEED